MGRASAQGIRPVLICALAFVADTFIASLRLPIPQLLPILVLCQFLQWPRPLPALAICALGLIQDALWLAPLGQHALALMVLLGAARLLHRRIYLLDNWRLSPAIMVLYLVWELVHGSIGIVRGYPISPGHLLIEAMLVAPLWPLISLAVNIWVPARR